MKIASSIWDLYRSVFPFFTILDPGVLSELINSLVDTYKHEGFLPDCRMSLCKGFTQGGSNADVLIGDAYVKNISGINWDDAYKAVVNDAEVEPPNWSVEGRGGLTSWKNLGYIPTDDFDPYGVGPHTRSISRTVEYAYNDFCIAEMADGLGHKSDYQKYIKRSGNWQNMFLADQTSTVNGQLTNFTGFLQPRYPNGTYGFQDPAFCSPLLEPDSCFLNPTGHETYEASIWLYTLYVKSYR
jgi:putative alpha-1,2-mannosidase